MEFGHFFSMDNTSRPEHNEVRFVYTAFRSGKGKKFPIYLAFKDDHISFYFNGYVKHNRKDELVETKLFSLHLHNDKQTQKELEEELKKLYDGKFPLKEKYEVIPPAIKNNSNNKGLKNYKKLEVFGNENVKSNRIYYKDIILDFFQDFNHSDVFEHCKQYSKIKHLIKESPFLYAIANKAKYCYLIENFNNKNKQNFKENHYTINLIKSQKSWLDILEKEESNKFINSTNKWFKDIEFEANNTLKVNLFKIIKKENSKKLTGEKKKNFNSYENKLFENKLKFSSWFIQRNNILKAWFLFDKIKWFFYVSLIFIFYTISSISLKINEIEPFCNIPEWNIKENALFILIVLIGFGFFSTLFDEKKCVLGKLSKFNTLLLKLWMIPLWVLLFGSSMIVFEITSYYNKEFIQNDWTYSIYILIIATLLIIFVYKLLYYYYEKYYKKIMDINIHIFPKIELTLVKRKILFNITFLYIVFIFILFLFFYNSFSNTNTSYIKISLILLILSLFILFNNEREKHKYLEKATSINKTLSMLFYGLVISFFANLAIYHTLYKEYLEQYQYLGYIWEHTQSINPNDAKNHENKKHNINYPFYTYTGEKLHEIEKYAKTPLSDEVNVYIDKTFFEELTKVRYTVKKDKHDSIEPKHNQTDKTTNIPTVLKKINTFGFEFYTIPSVIFINTLLSLLVAVILQIILHRKKFLEGGEAE